MSETKQELWAQVTKMLHLDEKQTRLLTAIHEAGHIVVADTVGIHVRSAVIVEDDGVYSAATNLDTGGRALTLGEHLVICAAGFQATYYWMSRPLPGVLDDAILNDNLLIPAAHDYNACDDTCQAAGHTELGMQDGIEPAARILKARWSTVIRIAYDLDRMGVLIRAELLAHLADQTRNGGQRARNAYDKWATEFVARVSQHQP